jgi:putative membrane protein
VYGVGDEPDARFTFANERTFLAWIRTSLALIAAGVSLDAFVRDLPSVVRGAIGIALVVTGIVAGGTAYLRWTASERAMRLRQPLPGFVLAPLLTMGIVAIGLVLAVLMLIRR